MTEATGKQPYEGWTILELMGHRRLAGYVREEDHFGTAMLRIDIPGDGESVAATQYYGGQSIYCLTPTTEAIARQVAKGNRPEPVHRWELPAPKDEARSSTNEICTDCGHSVQECTCWA